MIQHGPDSLVGPLRGTSAWWHGRPAEDNPPAEPTPPAPPTRTRKRAPRKIRTELVARVRAEIAAGTYDTPDRFQAALERLIERMGE